MIDLQQLLVDLKQVVKHERTQKVRDEDHVDRSCGPIKCPQKVSSSPVQENEYFRKRDGSHNKSRIKKSKKR